MGTTFPVISQLKGSAIAASLPVLKSSRSIMGNGLDIVLQAPEGITKGACLLLVICVEADVSFSKKTGWKKHKQNEWKVCYTKIATGGEGSELVQWTRNRTKATGFYMVINEPVSVCSLANSEALPPSTEIVATASAIVKNGLAISSAGYFNLVISPA